MTYDIAELYERIVRGHRVTTDSRNIRPGDVFVALKGANFNGNRYAASALAQGASAAIIDEPSETGEHRFLVPDALKCLQELAHHHRCRLGIPILGITGTNGKTTTKELCHAVLSRKYKVTTTQGNLNNHIGVPLTLLAMDENTQFGIVEMGANHPGEIKMLCDIADPDYGIITNIGHAHLEGFGSYENIIATKSALYDHILAKKGRLFVNASDGLLMRLSEGHTRNTYGREGDLLRGDVKQTVPYLTYALHTMHGDLYVRTRLVGGYNFDNAMAASAVGTYFGMDPLDIRDAIEAYTPSNLRSQLIKTERNTLILDAYNANPSSMHAALSNFIEMPGEHKSVILGEMLELGAESHHAHTALLQLAFSGTFEHIYLVGKSFAPTSHESVIHLEDTDALIRTLHNHPLRDAFILIKGSRGNQLERIVEYL